MGKEAGRREAQDGRTRCPDNMAKVRARTLINLQPRWHQESMAAVFWLPLDGRNAGHEAVGLHTMLKADG